jgi:hypothetical protein
MPAIGIGRIHQRGTVEVTEMMMNKSADFSHRYQPLSGKVTAPGVPAVRRAKE